VTYEQPRDEVTTGEATIPIGIAIEDIRIVTTTIEAVPAVVVEEEWGSAAPS
jgi:hypothetical protein